MASMNRKGDRTEKPFCFIFFSGKNWTAFCGLVRFELADKKVEPASFNRCSHGYARARKKMSWFKNVMGIMLQN